MTTFRMISWLAFLQATMVLVAALVLIVSIFPSEAVAQVNASERSETAGSPPAVDVPQFSPEPMQASEDRVAGGDWETGGETVGLFPIFNCGDWGAQYPWSIMRRGWANGGPTTNPKLERFGWEKARHYHSIDDPIKLWHRTLLVAQLGNGCNSSGNASMAKTKFMGYTCTWGEKVCVLAPWRTKTVKALEVNDTREQFAGSIWPGDKRIGNLTLYCDNGDKNDLPCPPWISGALPYAADSPNDAQ